jgi:hypothetical protein
MNSTTSGLEAQALSAENSTDSQFRGRIRFTPDLPCPVCGGNQRDDRGNGKRCHGYFTSKTICCSREEYGHGCELNGGGLYNHRRFGPCKCGQTHNPLEPRGEVIAIYQYEGWQKVRYVPKNFKIRRPDGNGGWIYKREGCKLSIYNRQTLLAAPLDIPVWIVEGEKDVDNLTAVGKLATCGPDGRSPWHKEWFEDLRGRVCYIIPDNDLVGHEHARRVAQSLQGVAASVRMIELPGVGPGKDVSDWLDAGGTVDQLDELAARTPEWKPVEGEAASAGNKDKAEIEITTERHVVRDQAIRALAKEDQIFLRGNALATVSRGTEETRKLFGGSLLRNANGTHSINVMTEPRLGCFLTENAALVTRHKTRKGEYESSPCHPPAWLIQAVLCHGEYPGFKDLWTVTECPYFNTEGNLIFEPTYDERTGTLLVTPFTVAPMTEFPKKEDASDAWGRIHEVMREFPWASGYDETVWLAALLTAIQRSAIMSCVPGFAFNGNKAGCGKGLAIDIIGLLVWGGPVPCCQYPKSVEEADKTTLSIALQGICAVHFDNLEEGSQYGNGAMDSALTSTAKSGRMLGQNRWVEGIPLRPCWFLSGNNISPTKDAFRRWLPCNLKTDLENPHERMCEVSNLKAYIAEHRSEIMRDAFVILRAWYLAGQPNHGFPPLGSFEEWDRMIRAAVWFATGNDCLYTQRQATEASPDRIKKMALIQAWKKLPDQEKGITASQAVKMAKDTYDGKKDGLLIYPELNSALSELGWKGDVIDSNRLGYVIRGIQNTNYGGFKFVKGESKGQHRVQWCVIEV